MIQLLGAASPIISALFKTVDKVVDSKEEKDRIKGEIQEQALAGEMKEISTAANIISSVNSFASDSTINTPLLVAATTKSS